MKKTEMLIGQHYLLVHTPVNSGKSREFGTGKEITKIAPSLLPSKPLTQVISRIICMMGLIPSLVSSNYSNKLTSTATVNLSLVINMLLRISHVVQ